MIFVDEFQNSSNSVFAVSFSVVLEVALTSHSVENPVCLQRVIIFLEHFFHLLDFFVVWFGIAE